MELLKINYRKEQGGYIALIAAIIISALLMLVAVSVTTSGFFTRFNILDTEAKQSSYDLAKSCLNYAILEFVINPTLLLPGKVNLFGQSCSIITAQQVVSQPGQVTIQSDAMVGQSYTKLQEVFDQNNFSLVSFQQLP